MNFPFLFDYPKHMIYPDGDRLAFESYSDAQYIPGIACCLHLFEDFQASGLRDRIVSLSRCNSRSQA